jgi:hypothetical protein
MTACGIGGIQGSDDVGLLTGFSAAHGIVAGKSFNYGLPIWGELSQFGFGWLVGLSWHGTMCL